MTLAPALVCTQTLSKPHNAAVEGPKAPMLLRAR